MQKWITVVLKNRNIGFSEKKFMSKVDQKFNLDLRRFRFEIGWVVLAAHGQRSYGWTCAHAVRKKKSFKRVGAWWL